MFMFIRSPNAEQVLFMRLSGCCYGILLAAIGFGSITTGITGEIWLVVNDTVVPATFTLTNFNDGFAVLWFWIILLGSMGMIALSAEAYYSFKAHPADEL
jgi:hypothetical protein